MEKVKKTMKLLDYIRWASVFLGAFMCVYTEPMLGSTLAVVLGMAAGLGFMFVCDNAKKGTLCEHVASDLGTALRSRGFERCSFEIRSLKTGLIIRIYMIRAGENAIFCNGIVMQRIQQAWYKEMVWITQLVDLNSEEEIDEARQTLDDELLEELKKMRDDARGRK